MALKCITRKRPLKLWRTARPGAAPTTPRGFWSNESSYPHFIHPGWPLYHAVLPAGTTTCRAKRLLPEVLLEAITRQADAVCAPAWDYYAMECLVQHPKKLVNLQVVSP